MVPDCVPWSLGTHAYFLFECLTINTSFHPLEISVKGCARQSVGFPILKVLVFIYLDLIYTFPISHNLTKIMKGNSPHGKVWNHSSDGMNSRLITEQSEVRFLVVPLGFKLKDVFSFIKLSFVGR